MEKEDHFALCGLKGKSLNAYVILPSAENLANSTYIRAGNAY